MYQISGALGLQNVGLVFQELLTRLEGSEDQSLVTGLVDLKRVKDANARK
jgi:hypothetical protein